MRLTKIYFIVNAVSYPDCVVSGLLGPHASPSSIGWCPTQHQIYQKKIKNSILYLQRSVTAFHSRHQANDSISHSGPELKWESHSLSNMFVKHDCANVESECHQSMWRWVGIPQLNTKEEEKTNNNKEEETQLWCCDCTVDMCLLITGERFLILWNFKCHTLLKFYNKL